MSQHVTEASNQVKQGHSCWWEMEALMAYELAIGRQSHLLIAGQVLHPCRGRIMQHQPLELQQVKKRLKYMDTKINISMWEQCATALMSKQPCWFDVGLCWFDKNKKDYVFPANTFAIFLRLSCSVTTVSLCEWLTHCFWWQIRTFSVSSSRSINPQSCEHQSGCSSSMSGGFFRRQVTHRR